MPPNEKFDVYVEGVRDASPGGIARAAQALAPRLAAVIFPSSSTRRRGSLMHSNKLFGQSASRFSSAFRFRC